MKSRLSDKLNLNISFFAFICLKHIEIVIYHLFDLILGELVLFSPNYKQNLNFQISVQHIIDCFQYFFHNSGF